ncbi:MAG: sulfite exporter TauE/SafE family protein, partial [Alphaproteobacteria bacterium]
LLVLTLVAILWSGWRYTGPRGAPVSATVGALGGFLSGSTGNGGPPAIFYLMSSGDGPALIRANLIGYFTVIGAGLIAYYSYQGLIGADVLWRAGLLVLFFVAGIVAGTRLFGFASPATFRHIALTVLAATSTWVLLA